MMRIAVFVATILCLWMDTARACVGVGTTCKEIIATSFLMGTIKECVNLTEEGYCLCQYDESKPAEVCNTSVAPTASPILLTLAPTPSPEPEEEPTKLAETLIAISASLLGCISALLGIYFKCRGSAKVEDENQVVVVDLNV